MTALPEPPRRPILTRALALRTFLFLGPLEAALGFAGYLGYYLALGWRPFESLDPYGAGVAGGGDAYVPWHRRRTDRLSYRPARRRARGCDFRRAATVCWSVGSPSRSRWRWRWSMFPGSTGCF
ncbi:MAG: hypothetical protein U0531_00580 [Dehalococcoidia bacterium]